MFDSDNAYAMQQVGSSTPTLGRTPTMKERIKMAVDRAEEQLADAKRAQQILDSNPELQELIDIMNRARI